MISHELGPPSRRKRESTRPALERPFNPKILEAARRIAAQYSIVVEPDEPGFVGYPLEFHTAFGRGGTAEECIGETRKVATLGVATMLEAGQKPPAPAVEGNRDAQMNVRLTAEEKLLLERSARRSGFRGVSDFVRHAALNRAMGLDVPPSVPVTPSARAKSERGGRARRRTRSSASRG